jgi:site-specific DNA-methyltransferase (adenine-specific)
MALRTQAKTRRAPAGVLADAPAATHAAATVKATKATKASGEKAATGAVPTPAFAIEDGTNSRRDARVYVGDCRDVLRGLMPAIKGKVDLVFADPPFNWNRAYDKWDDAMPDAEYLRFTYDWLDLCHEALRPGGAMWVNIPDDWAAEIVVHMKAKRWTRLVNWCVWHYRFGQNLTERFINSKVHALYFVKGEGVGGSELGPRTWNANEVLEMSDRAAIYGDRRTQSKKDGMPPGLRVPMDVWYGPFWGRIQGNNKERRAQHDNQLPEVYLERVVRSTSNAGDLVMDPFLGSGTTGVVAHALGRRFIGVEYSKENAGRAFERIGAGPVRPLGQQRGMSSAIHPKRATLKIELGDE